MCREIIEAILGALEAAKSRCIIAESHVATSFRSVCFQCTRFGTPACVLDVSWITQKSPEPKPEG